MAIHIVLVEPEIPPNTGNIARTAAATDSVLHLVKPLGFSIDDKSLRRAGLDYWHMMTLEIHESWQDFCEKYPDARLHFATTKAPHDYCGVQYADEDFLVFGRETKGLASWPGSNPASYSCRRVEYHPLESHPCTGYRASE